MLFAHGTCVVLAGPTGDLAEQAAAILAEYGPVRPGGPADNFATITLDAAPGWVVSGHHPDMLTYVAPEDVTEPNDLMVGLTGRANRDRDAATCRSCISRSDASNHGGSCEHFCEHRNRAGAADQCAVSPVSSAFSTRLANACSRSKVTLWSSHGWFRSATKTATATSRSPSPACSRRHAARFG